LAVLCICAVSGSHGRHSQSWQDTYLEQPQVQKVFHRLQSSTASKHLQLNSGRETPSRLQALAFLLRASNAAIAQAISMPPRLVAGKDESKHVALLKEARGNKAKMMDAYRTLKKKLDADPENTSLKLACAEAAVSVMRIAGNANSLTCHFKKGRRGALVAETRTSDTPENKAVWAELAPAAQRLLADVEKDVGRDVFNKEGCMFSLGLEACMYAVASRGIVSAIVSGKAPSFLKRVSKLEKMHKEWDGSQYCIYKGAYLQAAPRPVYDPKKAREYFELAAKKHPRSKRNQYFAGVGRFANGDFKGAREAMERAMKEPCGSKSETDIGDFLAKQSARTIQMLKQEGY